MQTSRGKVQLPSKQIPSQTKTKRKGRSFDPALLMMLGEEMWKEEPVANVVTHQL